MTHEAISSQTNPHSWTYLIDDLTSNIHRTRLDSTRLVSRPICACVCHRHTGDFCISDRSGERRTGPPRQRGGKRPCWCHATAPFPDFAQANPQFGIEKMYGHGEKNRHSRIYKSTLHAHGGWTICMRDGLTSGNQQVLGRVWARESNKIELLYSNFW